MDWPRRYNRADISAFQEHQDSTAVKAAQFDEVDQETYEFVEWSPDDHLSSSRVESKDLPSDVYWSESPGGDEHSSYFLSIMTLGNDDLGSKASVGAESDIVRFQRLTA